MNLTDLTSYAPVAAIGLLVLLAIAFTVYRSVSMESSWEAHIRALLEQQGFRVQRMERRWLTKGPFPDLRPPGTKNHTEWLVRVIVDDPSGTRRAGWVRWRRNWPGEQEDRWAVRWDEEPWGASARQRTKGLSTAAFYGLMLATMAVVFSLVAAIASRAL
jgi:hypothetical protein